MPHPHDPAATASLPMYDLPELQDAHRALWLAIASTPAGRALGLPPGAFRLSQPPVPARIGTEVLFTQVCGFPLQTAFAGQFRLLGVPRYDVPGCDDAPCDRPPSDRPGMAGPSHCGVFVVADSSPARTLEDLRGMAFGCNSLLSNSGMSLPRRTLAAIAGGRPFFARVAMTGSHFASLAAIRSGEVDAASVDCVTWAMCERHRPSAVAGLRVLARTVPSPAIPFVTSISTPLEAVLGLQATLSEVSADPACAPLLATLGIAGIEAPDGSDYGQLLRYVEEARELSFPTLA